MMVLDILKLLFAKDTREGVLEAVKALRATPDWRRDLIELEETFRGSEDNKARILIRLVRELLLQKGLLRPPGAYDCENRASGRARDSVPGGYEADTPAVVRWFEARRTDTPATA